MYFAKFVGKLFQDKHLATFFLAASSVDSNPVLFSTTEHAFANSENTLFDSKFLERTERTTFVRDKNTHNTLLQLEHHRGLLRVFVCDILCRKIDGASRSGGKRIIFR